MAINPLGMNQGTNSFIRFEDDGGTINTQVVDLRQGTVTLSNPTGTTVQFNNGTVDLLKAGTITKLEQGSIQVTAGTVTAGTLTNLVSGTINSATAVLNSGTISVIPNTPGGTLGLVTTVSNLTNGSVRVTLGTTVAGTLNLLDTVTNLTSGSVRMTVGTLTVMPNVPGGTLGVVSLLSAGTVTRLEQGSIAVTAGTITNLLKTEDAGHTTGDAGIMPLAVRVDGGTSLVGTDLDYGPLQLDANGALRVSGTVETGASVSVGTIPEITNIVGGTITRLAQGSINVTAGTVSAGTINTGTINTGTINVGTVTGNVASGATDSGNPVKIGGINNTTQPTLTDGQRGDVQLDTRGNVKTVIYGNNSTTSITNVSSNADAVAVTSTGAFLGVRSNTMVYNNTSWDRMRGDTGGLFINPQPGLTISSAGTTSAGTIGTLIAAPGTGTAIYVTGFHVLQVSGTAETVVSFGLQAAGNQVVARGNYAAGGGITESKTFPSGYGATGTALTWNMLSGSGTVSYKVEYFTR